MCARTCGAEPERGTARRTSSASSQATEAVTIGLRGKGHRYAGEEVELGGQRRPPRSSPGTRAPDSVTTEPGEPGPLGVDGELLHPADAAARRSSRSKRIPDTSREPLATSTRTGGLEGHRRPRRPRTLRVDEDLVVESEPCSTTRLAGLGAAGRRGAASARSGDHDRAASRAAQVHAVHEGACLAASIEPVAGGRRGGWATSKAPVMPDSAGRSLAQP